MSNRIVARRIMEKVASRRNQESQLEGMLKEAYEIGVRDGMQKVAKRTYGDVVGDVNAGMWNLITPRRAAYDSGRLTAAGDAAGVTIDDTIKRPFVSPLKHSMIGLGAGVLGGGLAGAATSTALGGNTGDGTIVGAVAGGAVGTIAGTLAYLINRKHHMGVAKDELSKLPISNKDKIKADDLLKTNRYTALNPVIPGAWTRGRDEAAEAIRSGGSADGVNYTPDALINLLGIAGGATNLPLAQGPMVGVDIYDRIKAARVAADQRKSK